MQENEVTEVLMLLQKNYPDAKTELEYQTAFQLLVATILSAQSTDVQVNKVTKKVFLKYPDAESFARLTAEQLMGEIKTIGLFRNKSKNIVEASRIIVTKHQGRVPDNIEELVALPGVGRKTANVVLANAFGQDAIAVDTHVFRVANRIGLVKTKNPQDTEYALQKVIPKRLWSNAHHWLIFHGRRVCHAKKPQCQNCSLNKLCYYRKNQN